MGIGSSFVSGVFAGQRNYGDRYDCVSCVLVEGLGNILFLFSRRLDIGQAAGICLGIIREFYSPTS